MDELNYRRLMSCEKQRCEDCGATAYSDPDDVFRCVVCDHERFETCLDCGHLHGWCTCEPVATTVTKRRARRPAKKK